MPPKSLATRKKRAKIVRNELIRLFPGSLQTPLHYRTHWELVVAVILSAQCTDEMVNRIIRILFRRYRSLKDYLKADPREFKKIVKPCGFFNSKTKAILQSAKIIHKDYNGKVPRTMKDLMRLPGVGRKSANVILGNLFHHVEGIAVDTHVIRLSRKFQLTKHSVPFKIEKDLMKLLPKKDWWDFSYRLKVYGRTYSPARKKDDDNDPISRKIKSI